MVMKKSRKFPGFVRSYSYLKDSAFTAAKREGKFHVNYVNDKGTIFRWNICVRGTFSVRNGMKWYKRIRG